MSTVRIKGDTSGYVDLVAPAVAGNSTIALDKVVATDAAGDIANISSINGGQVGGRRNLIINGAMQVAQRGTSFTNISTGSGYTLDRWAYEFSGSTDGVITIAQDTDAPDGFASSLKVTTTTAQSSPAANARVQLRCRFEGQDVQHLNYGSSSAKSFTVSFWVKSTKTGTQTIGLYKVDGNNVASRNYTVNSSGTWEYKSVVIGGDTANAINNDNTFAFQIGFGLVAGSNYTSGTADGTWQSSVTNQYPSCPNNLDTVGNVFQITGVQLEIGDTATSFEHRSYGEELSLCQRYYQFIDSVSTQGQGANLMFHRYLDSSNVYASSYQYFTTMRAAPSITFESGMRCHLPAISVESGTFGSSSISNQGAWLQVTPGTTNNSTVKVALIDGDGTNSKKVSFDAEL